MKAKSAELSLPPLAGTSQPEKIRTRKPEQCPIVWKEEEKKSYEIMIFA